MFITPTLFLFFATQIEDLKISVAVVGNRPLPYQAVRLRVMVENPTPNKTFLLSAMDSRSRVNGIKQPADAQMIKWLVPSLDHDRSLIIAVADSAFPKHLDEPFALKPGQWRSVTFPVGLMVEPYSTPRKIDPLFPAPGKYVLRCEYVYGSKSRTALSVHRDVTVEVAQPDKNDEPWVAALAGDPILVQAMLLWENAPTAEQAATCQELIEKAPDSTYADYGRLLIARFHTSNYGRGDPKYSYRVNRAMAADTLDPITSGLHPDRFPFAPFANRFLIELDAENRESHEFHALRAYRDSRETIDYMSERLPPDKWRRFRQPLPWAEKPRQ